MDLYKKKSDDDEKEQRKIRDNRGRELIESGDAEIVFNDSDYIVITPHTYEASQIFAYNSKWCTYLSENYFNKYTTDGPLYIIMIKKTKERVQYYYSDNGYFDFSDIDNKAINTIFFFKTHTKLHDLFNKLNRIPPLVKTALRIITNTNINQSDIDSINDEMNGIIGFTIDGYDNNNKSFYTEFTSMNQLDSNFDLPTAKYVASILDNGYVDMYHNGHTEASVFDIIARDIDSDVFHKLQLYMEKKYMDQIENWDIDLSSLSEIYLLAKENHDSDLVYEFDQSYANGLEVGTYNKMYQYFTDWLRFIDATRNGESIRINMRYSYFADLIQEILIDEDSVDLDMIKEILKIDDLVEPNDWDDFSESAVAERLNDGLHELFD